MCPVCFAQVEALETKMQAKGGDGFGFFSMAGKNVIVTGGASGIGYAICEMFATRGANVRIHPLHPARSARVALFLVAESHLSTRETRRRHPDHACSETQTRFWTQVFLLDLFPEATATAADKLTASTGRKVHGIPCNGDSSCSSLGRWPTDVATILLWVISASLQPAAHMACRADTADVRG